MDLNKLDMSKPMAHARMVRMEKYAWPGGYAMALIFADGEAACADCVKENFHLISDDTREHYRVGWKAVGSTHAGECDEEIYCACCSEPIFGFDEE